MKLNQLLSVIDGEIYGDETVEFSNLCLDSRQASVGDLFFAVPGHKFDGLQFVPGARQRGAVAVVTEVPPSPEDPICDFPRLVVSDVRRALGRIAHQFYCCPTTDLATVGITGTNGKTTTTYILQSILNHSQLPTALLGTVHYTIGDEVLPAPNTTPDSLTIHRLAHRARERDCRAMVMEVSSHALDQGRVEGVDFDVAVFTNLSGDHLDYHGTMNHYLDSKARLFEGLASEKKALFNIHDPHSSEIAKRTPAEVIYYGIDCDKADICARGVELKLSHTGFILDTPKGKAPVETKLIGRHNVLNCLAAAGAAISLGVPLEQVVAGISNLSGVPGRLEPVPNRRDLTVLVDYAHTDDALKNILSYLRKIATGEIITVFGCGGDRDRTKRPRMGAVAGEYSDWVVVTSDNPRSEEPRRIIADIEEGMTGTDFEVVVDRRAAIQRAVERAQPGDVVLIAGKGHEDYQEGADGRIWFDDRVVARKVLETRDEKCA